MDIQPIISNFQEILIAIGLAVSSFYLGVKKMTRIGANEDLGRVKSKSETSIIERLQDLYDKSIERENTLLSILSENRKKHDDDMTELRAQYLDLKFQNETIMRKLRETEEAWERSKQEVHALSKYIEQCITPIIPASNLFDSHPVFNAPVFRSEES